MQNLFEGRSHLNGLAEIKKLRCYRIYLKSECKFLRISLLYAYLFLHNKIYIHCMHLSIKYINIHKIEEFKYSIGNGEIDDIKNLN